VGIGPARSNTHTQTSDDPLSEVYRVDFQEDINMERESKSCLSVYPWLSTVDVDCVRVLAIYRRMVLLRGHQ
jgi:hypothetical protein